MKRDDKPARVSAFWSRSASDQQREPVISGSRISRLLRERPDLVSIASQRLVHIALFAGILALLLLFFQPSLLFSSTTVTGGDSGAHIYAPWYLKEHLLPKGLISGWSPGWFAGFPILTFYFPLVPLIQVLLSYVAGYEIAFKIGTVLGTFFLPAGVFLTLKLMRFSFPTPIAGAVASLGFLFMDSYSIYGGNIPSSLSGEYSFALSIGLCLVFYGLAYRLAREDRGRPILASAVLAGAVVSHMIPVIMMALTVPLLLFWSVRRHGVARTAGRFGAVFGLAFALTAFWSVPFLVRIGYVANMRWQSLEGWGNLLPRELWVYLGMAGIACILAVMRRDDRVLLLLWPGLAGVAVYFFLPQGHAWNGRFIPFWYLSVFLCAAYAIGAAISLLARPIWKRRAAGLAVVMTALVLVGIGGWTLREKQDSYIDDWIRLNYSGYEPRAEYPQFKALMETMDALPPGRIMWEPTNDLSRFGTPIALMTFPYWTDQPTMEGLYYESSITTPFHFLIASEVAKEPSNPIADLPYGELDLERALQHMRMYDVRYFIASSERAKREAKETEGYELLDRVAGLSIYELASAQVTVPKNEPVVLEGADWVEANLKWFTRPGDFDTPLVADGPKGLPRVQNVEDLPTTPLTHGGETFDAEVGDDSISFKTDAVGQPHLVRTSFFPNWSVEGAEGPFLASPTVMMVIPTQNEVRLEYRRTWAEWSGLILTLATLVTVAVPRTRRWVARSGGVN